MNTPANLVSIDSARRPGPRPTPSPQVDEDDPNPPGSPAAVKLEAQAHIVIRQVRETRGNILAVAKIHGVRANDIGRILARVLPGQEAA